MNHDEKILILTNEPIWLKLASEPEYVVISPDLWDIEFKNGLVEIQDEEDFLSYKIKSILLREGHLYPSEKYKKFILKIKESKIPCINDTAVTLACLDTIGILQKIQENKILKKYCVTTITDPVNISDQNFPFVLKIPDFHSGSAKWLIRNSNELNELLSKQIKIKIGDFTKFGYLQKEPLVSKKLLVEPFIKGKDLRIWVVKNRENNCYVYQGLEREAQEGEWMANIYTRSYRLFNEIDSEIVSICTEASKILKEPDIFAVDLKKDKNKLYILEIHNDVPGLASLEENKDYTLHKLLLQNCKIIG